MSTQPTIIVFDSPYSNYLGNNVFIKTDLYLKVPGASWLKKLDLLARGRGWKCVTSDIYLKDPSPSRAFLISEAITSNTNQLIRSGVIPFILLSGESPNVDIKFFNRINDHSSLFKHTFLFEGLRKYVSPATTFHPFLWPNNVSNAVSNFDVSNWSSRKRLVMISSNKTRFSVPTNVSFRDIRKLKKRIEWRYFRISNPLFRFDDLYTKRLEAIQYFARTDGFDLFGQGWDNLTGLRKSWVNAIKTLRPTAVPSKLDKLKRYKFSLCFENCVFPGYITEKIFDCFFAGTIPIYYGAPDVEAYIPSGCFIDFKKFESFEDLNQFITRMSENEIKQYLEAIANFLCNQKLNAFSDDTMAESIVQLVDQEIKF